MAGTDLTPNGGDDMGRPKGFDDYEVRLGDLLRGERATLGKSVEAQGVVSVTLLSRTPYPITQALESVSVYKNIKLFDHETVFLTVDGKILHEIPAEKAETIVYEVQKKLDEAAVLEGREFGKLVSTRKIN